MKFTDEASVRVIGGRGGDGAVHWRREKFVPQGGPDGGEGGDGGAVVFCADENLNTLIDFALNPVVQAENGAPGGGNNMAGRHGEHTVLPVPVGTQVFWEEQIVADFAAPGARWIAARGGRGGKGNSYFASATNQAPDRAQKGKLGDDRSYSLVLKSVADVGLVGMPNVGKSSFISRVSRAQPKVADYPFTTLVPHLGTVALDSGARFVVADIPGLIPGAHEGKGLGLQFLRHIERTKCLLHFIDVTLEPTIADPVDAGDELLLAAALRQFAAIEQELLLFDEKLGRYPRIVVFSKADLHANTRAFELSREYFVKRNLPVALISSASGAGVSELLNDIAQLLRSKSAT